MDNKNFWNERYLTFPELGSGPGSRGYSSWLKQDLMRTILESNRIESIIDIGCGDLCWLTPGLLDGIDYIGVDISEIIIKVNRHRFPLHTFILSDISKESLPVIAPDLVICLDVLLHQCDRDTFDSALRNILFATTKHGLISYPVQQKVDTFLPAQELPQAILEMEESFRQMDADLGSEIPRGEVECFGDLATEIRRIDSSIAVRPLIGFRSDIIYEVSKIGDWLEFKRV